MITPRTRPKITQGTTERVRTGCGSLFVTVNKDEQGIIEVFATIGHTGQCAIAQMEGLCRILSIAIRSGVELDALVNQLTGIRCPSTFHDGVTEVLSCADAIASVLAKEIPKEVDHT